MSSEAIERPIRVGIFGSVDNALQVIRELTALGYTKEHIAVICSDETKEKYFSKYEEEAAGDEAKSYLAAGSEVGAIVGGMTALAGVVTMGGAAVLAAGAVLTTAVTGAIVGGLVGLMMTRGIDKQEADFYDRAVTEGKILISVEDESDNAQSNLAKVERIFEEHGVEPVELEQK